MTSYTKDASVGIDQEDDREKVMGLRTSSTGPVYQSTSVRVREDRHRWCHVTNYA